MPKLTANAVEVLARENDFTGQDVVIMTAIAEAESGFNTEAHNTNASTGDNSYGLWQINMLGSMGPVRRKAFGITSDEQLFDPKINAHAARVIYNQQGFAAWSTYKSGAYKNTETWKNPPDPTKLVNTFNQAEKDAQTNNPWLAPVMQIGTTLRESSLTLMVVIVAVVLLALGILILNRSLGKTALKVATR